MYSIKSKYYLRKLEVWIFHAAGSFSPQKRIFAKSKFATKPQIVNKEDVAVNWAIYVPDFLVIQQNRAIVAHSTTASRERSF